MRELGKGRRVIRVIARIASWLLRLSSSRLSDSSRGPTLRALSAGTWYAD